MEENHQNQIESKLSPPPLSSKDQGWKARSGFWGYDKETKEYELRGRGRTIGQLVKITKEHQRGKTLWDWIQLALQVIGAFTVVLTLITLLVSVQQFKEQQKNENDRAIKQQSSEQLRAIDQQQQTTLEIYLDRMSDLLFVQHLDTSKPGDEVGQVARARTLTALQNLNPARKGILLQFLYESHLIGYYDPTHRSVHGPLIVLSGADLTQVDLTQVDLNGANLSGTNLGEANLRYANLDESHLSGANLNGANLSGARLRNAHLNGAYLSNAQLRWAYLSSADLEGALLDRADLNEADVRYANLREADLNGAYMGCREATSGERQQPNFEARCTDFSGADLTKANFSIANPSLRGTKFSGANLHGVNLFDTDISGAKFSGANLSGANLIGQQTSS